MEFAIETDALYNFAYLLNIPTVLTSCDTGTTSASLFTVSFWPPELIFYPKFYYENGIVCACSCYFNWLSFIRAERFSWCKLSIKQFIFSQSLIDVDRYSLSIFFFLLSTNWIYSLKNWNESNITIDNVT